MNPYNLQRLCVWSGVAAIVSFFFGFVFAGFLPPPSPSWTVELVVAHYQEHADGIRGGMVLMMLSGMFVCPLVAVISAQMRRIPGAHPVLVYAQLSAGTLGAVFFITGALLFLVTAFRPDRAPELTFLLNDAAWIVTVIPFSPAFMQNLIIAIGILGDRGPNPVFPRWLAFFNIWVALGFLPGGLLPFFKSGPLAWNGLFVFWLAGSVFAAWFIVMTLMLFKAIRAQEQAARAHE